jgi:hypothetical protein
VRVLITDTNIFLGQALIENLLFEPCEVRGLVSITWHCL